MALAAPLMTRCGVTLCIPSGIGFTAGDIRILSREISFEAKNYTLRQNSQLPAGKGGSLAARSVEGGCKIARHDGLIAIRASGNHAHSCARFFLDEIQIVARLGRQLGKFRDADRRFLPAGHRMVNAFQSLESAEVRRNLIRPLAVEFVADANRDLSQ